MNLPRMQQAMDPVIESRKPEGIATEVQKHLRELGRRQRTDTSDTIAALALLRRIQVKTIRLSGVFPVSVETDFPVVAVIAGACSKAGGSTGDGSDARPTQVAWRQSDDEAETGIVVQDVTGPTWEYGIEWDVTLCMIGEVS